MHPNQAARKEAAYAQLALQHAQTTGKGGTGEEPLPVIEPGTAHWDAWERYFREHLGFDPMVMKRVRWGLSNSVTVPSEWPQDFDPSYQTASLISFAGRGRE